MLGDWLGKYRVYVIHTQLRRALAARVCQSKHAHIHQSYSNARIEDRITDLCHV